LAKPARTKSEAGEEVKAREGGREGGREDVPRCRRRGLSIFAKSARTKSEAGQEVKARERGRKGRVRGCLICCRYPPRR